MNLYKPHMIEFSVLLLPVNVLMYHILLMASDFHI